MRGVITDEHSEVIRSRRHSPFLIWRGRLLRIEDLEGQQAFDLICSNLYNLRETFWPAHSAKLSRTIYLSTGRVAYSDRASR